jgi:plastocyanin domain-containing protein
MKGYLAMKKLALSFLFCVGIAGYAVCRADTAPPEAVVYQATIAADGVQHVRIDGGSYFFKPNRVIVRVNVPVELTASVEKGLIPHTLVIQSPEAGISVDEKLSSDAKNIRFTPTAAGKYHFYCKNKLLFFKSHRDKGMEGVLEVIQ